MEAPRIPSMLGFKAKKANQFYFEPRYYNPRKEKMEKRYQRIGKELGVVEPEQMHKEDFKAEMRETWGAGYARDAAGGQLNKKVLFYVVALFAIAYFLIYF